MQSDQDRLEHARAVWEGHLRTCRSCAGSSGTCQSAKLLRRSYNSLLRAAGDGGRLPEANA
ncbi:hypothetical protein [Streptomyces sp. NPDC001068]|uniref:hypothetical protein n=1 Tax=Streptomyces sp. NPDC001068 TaxID=3364544 RepID=UPI0036D14FD5